MRTLGGAILLAGSALGCVSASIPPELVASEPGIRVPARPAVGEIPDRPAGQAPFSEGTTRFESYASAIGGDPGKGEMYALHAGAAHFLKDYLALSATLFGAYIRSGIDDNGGAGGFDLVLRRHYPENPAASWSLFMDAGAGCQMQSTNFSGPRHFNFRLIAGVGGTIALGKRWGLIAGIRYLHISDAGIEGGGGGYDGPMGYAGVTFGP